MWQVSLAKLKIYFSVGWWFAMGWVSGLLDIEWATCDSNPPCPLFSTGRICHGGCEARHTCFGTLRSTWSSSQIFLEGTTVIVLCGYQPRYPAKKLTWQWNIHHLKMYILLKKLWIFQPVMLVFRGVMHFNMQFLIHLPPRTAFQDTCGARVLQACAIRVGQSSVGNQSWTILLIKRMEGICWCMHILDRNVYIYI